MFTKAYVLIGGGLGSWLDGEANIPQWISPGEFTANSDIGRWSLEEKVGHWGHDLEVVQLETTELS